MYRFAFAFLMFCASALPAIGGEFLGNKMLEILGETNTAESFSKFKTEYLLDKSLKNPVLGIKLSATHDVTVTVSAIVLTASGCEMNEVKYSQFDGALPFNISWSDDANSLEQKLGASKGVGDDTRMKFKKDGITINVFFKNASRKKITYIKFTENIGLTGPYRLDGNHDPAAVAAAEEAVPAPIAPSNKISARQPVNTRASAADRNVTALPDAAEFGKTSATNKRTSQDPLYAAIMNVIESGEEEMFKNIKKEADPKSNFWNYKYTYSTSVSIPGEKYNMLYSFPFSSSQLDFVSVIDESDANNKDLSGKYKEMEEKLKSCFKLTDGWSYHYIVNQEDPHGIKDLELKNPKLGSIVLDYSVNPYGKRVLYLRFLLQYT